MCGMASRHSPHAPELLPHPSDSVPCNLRRVGINHAIDAVSPSISLNNGFQVGRWLRRNRSSVTGLGTEGASGPRPALIAEFCRNLVDLRGGCRINRRPHGAERAKPGRRCRQVKRTGKGLTWQIARRQTPRWDIIVPHNSPGLAVPVSSPKHGVLHLG